tara:strand:- start:583 stop:2715 length:2133 start_codon:yes stop_codon:yes gene_type:complete
VFPALFFLSGPVFVTEANTNSSSIKAFNFKVTPGLKTRVDFWKKIYSQYTTSQVIIHDQNYLDTIYEVVNFSPKLSQRQKEKLVEKVKTKYKKVLRGLSRKAKKKNLNLTLEEKRISKLVKGNYLQAARNIRIQLGQKDRFRDGLQRSGKYMTEIRKIFRSYGLPSELTVLPHVESSFQLNAYSSAGAAGIWQFTRGTGRRFMKIGYEVDERLDPILATDAAARLLKFNYEQLNTWPLAITAYNHGLQGMKRAKKRYGQNMEDIIRHYRSRMFGFASQNFYCEFLAALDIVQNQEKYFPGLQSDKPTKKKVITFRHYIDIQTAMRFFKMSRDEIKQYNPALRSPVIDGSKRIPRGFLFQVPDRIAGNVLKVYADISSDKKFRFQKASKWYRVRRGDTVSDVAVRFRTTVTKIKRLNHIGRRNLIYPGQVLQLPDRGSNNKKYRIARAKKELSNYSDTDSKTYRIRRYDNLSKIARRYRIDPLLLAAYNRMKNPDNVKPGQILRIPIRKKVSLSRVDVEKKKDHLVIRSVPVVRKKSPAVSAGIKLVKSEDFSSTGFNNRPAFFPVVFDSDESKSTKIGTITVDFDETVSHYAEWARLSLKKLRRINKLRGNHRIHVNRKIKVPFYKVNPEEFEQKRKEYHKAIQEDFFDNYEIIKTIPRKVKKGETIWDICNNIYSMPFWLLSMYNPDRDINSLDVGESILIPVVTRKSS